MRDPLLIDVPERFDTERLSLRAFRPGDGPLLLPALAESRAALRQFLGYLPWVAAEPSLESAELRCRECHAKFAARSDLPYLMFAGGRLVGSVGMHRIDWQLPKIEVGYWVRSGDAGRGYVSEGLQPLIDWAFHQLRAVRIELITDALNLPSRRIAERLGFTLEGVHRQVKRMADGRLADNCVYARVSEGDTLR
jgi:hypothetical protein